MLKYAQVCKIMIKFENLAKVGKVWNSTQRHEHFAKVCQKNAKLCQCVLKYSKVCKNVQQQKVKKMCQKSQGKKAHKVNKIQ